MAADKLVDSTQLNADLTEVADAIRAKAKLASSVKLAFPDDYVTQIGNLRTAPVVVEGTAAGGKTITITAPLN